MRLETNSLEDGSTLRSRLRLAIRQIQHEREVARQRLVMEAEGTAHHLIRDIQAVASARAGGNNAHFWWGSFGSQLDVSKVNGLAGMVVAYDETLELLQTVYNGIPEA